MAEIGDGHDALRAAVTQKQRRDHLNDTQFMRLAGITPKTFKAFMKGTRRTHEDKVGQIETAVGWHDAEDAGTGLDADQEEWIATAPGLDDAAKALVRNMIIAHRLDLRHGK